jgi:ribonucleoside-triphosphate reductase
MHNVSCTVSIKEHEWEKVGEWMWDNRDSYTGISVLPYNGGSYIQSPFESCSKEVFEDMVGHLHSIDLTKVTEEEDGTSHARDAVACSGSSCEVV